MTERSFRSPSPNQTPVPNRPASSHGPYPKYDHESAPPVPALPKDIQQKLSARPASVEPTQRMRSPAARKQAGRGVSLDRGPGKQQDQLQGVQTQGGVEAKLDPQLIAARTSVNFSRPMSPQNGSPNSPLVTSPKATKAGPSTELSSMEERSITRSISDAATKPVKKKKKIVAKPAAEGSHFASIKDSQNLEVASRESAGQSTPSPIQAAPSEPKKKRKKVVSSSTAQLSLNQDPAHDVSDTESVTSEKSNVSDWTRSANTRASGVLAKQPSIVREDREGEEKAEQKQPPDQVAKTGLSNGTVQAGTPANTSKVVSKERSQVRSASQQVTTKPSKPESQERSASLTPARATHFSSQPEYANLAAKHSPPARSVSPAKSALKTSPSRGHSPVVVRSGLAPSETSDTASQYSDDGSRSASRRRKKNVRVSFDEESVLIGRAADPPDTLDSPVVLSPQSKAKPQSWFDLVRDKKGQDSSPDQDENGILKPMPALPSFGSVRGRDQNTQKKTSKASAPVKSPEEGLGNRGSSTDAAIGHIITEEAANKDPPTNIEPLNVRSPNDPLPPEVTTVEGSGEHSDSEGEMDAMPPAETVLASGLEQKPENIDAQADEKTSSQEDQKLSNEQDLSLPTIAVEPASPAAETQLANRRSWLGMPGDFPSSTDAEEKKETSGSSDSTSKETTGDLPTSDGAGGRPAVDIQKTNASSAVGEIEKTPRPQSLQDGDEDGEETESSSIYSDAAEDQTDVEGDGFGSINAIVESPTSPTIPIQGRSPPTSPSISKAQRATNDSPTQKGDGSGAIDNAESWDQAQSYWASLSESRKKQLEQAAMPGAVDEPVVQNRTMRGANSVPKKKKRTKKAAQQAEKNTLVRSNSPQATKSGSPFRSNAAAPPAAKPTPPDPGRSLRTGSPMSTGKVTDKRTSLPPPETKVTLPKKTRPVSAAPAGNVKKPVQSTASNHAPASSAGITASPPQSTPMKSPKKKPAVKPSLLGRADSDSSSSFKRARTSTPDTSGYKMKRLMRGSTNETPLPSTNRPSSMSVRSSSPPEPGQRRPFSAIGGGSLRTSMRGPKESAKPVRTSLRTPKESSKSDRTKSPSRFGFGKSNKANNVPDKKPASRFSSRFGDSSDEEDGFPAAASSRFADSSDDESVDLAPVRGIPRRIDEGDSTDLEDSSAEIKSKAAVSKPAQNKEEPTTSTEGNALATGSLRASSGATAPNPGIGAGFQAKKAAEKEKKRRSFLGSFRGRRQDDAATPQDSNVRRPPRLETLPETAAVDTETLQSPKRTGPSFFLTSEMASPSSNGRGVGPGTSASPAQNSPKPPKLQRRHTPKSVTTAREFSWPLPQAPNGVGVEPENRPRTSEGGNPKDGSERPSLGLRQHTIQSEADARSPISVASPKKKKISFWKKAFGIGN